jgi:hypothetical protein
MKERYLHGWICQIFFRPLVTFEYGDTLAKGVSIDVMGKLFLRIRLPVGCLQWRIRMVKHDCEDVLEFIHSVTSRMAEQHLSLQRFRPYG